MKFSTTTRYGLRAIVYLAKKNRVCSVKEISGAEDISPAYLEKIILKLSKAGLIKVKRGTCGGYFLSQPAQDITVGDIVKILEKSTSPAPCVNPEYKCPRRHLCSTKDIWEKVYESINLTLDNITLGELIK